jgi:hypothetical protein
MFNDQVRGNRVTYISLSVCVMKPSWSERPVCPSMIRNSPCPPDERTLGSGSPLQNLN